MSENKTETSRYHAQHISLILFLKLKKGLKSVRAKKYHRRGSCSKVNGNVQDGLYILTGNSAIKVIHAFSNTKRISTVEVQHLETLTLRLIFFQPFSIYCWCDDPTSWDLESGHLV